jgi:hypothetical protein
MITSRELRNKLEEVMDMLTSNYTPAQWNAKTKLIQLGTKKLRKFIKKLLKQLIFAVLIGMMEQMMTLTL